MSHDIHQEFFDQLAEEWDLNFTAEDLERLTHLVDRFDVKPGMNIVDLGCGTGILFDMLRRRVGETGTVTGVDFSFKMAQMAHRNFPFANVNVVDADVSALPLKTSYFDMVTAFAAFPHFTDKANAIEEVRRILKPGAPFYIIHLESSKQLSEQHHRIGGIVAHDEIPTEEEMREMFAASSFENFTIEDHPGLYLASAINSK